MSLRLRNIRSLSISRLSKNVLSPEDFLDYGAGLEDVKLTFSGLQTIKSHAFQHVQNIRRLDLSENQISQVDNEAFMEIGRSLVSLKLSHALVNLVTALPAKALNHLTSLQELDCSNNKLKSIPESSFHFMKYLNTLDLSDNHIEQVAKGTFQVEHFLPQTYAEHTALEFVNNKHFSFRETHIGSWKQFCTVLIVLHRSINIHSLI